MARAPRINKPPTPRPPGGMGKVGPDGLPSGWFIPRDPITEPAPPSHPGRNISKMPTIPLI